MYISLRERNAGKIENMLRHGGRLNIRAMSIPDIKYVLGLRISKPTRKILQDRLAQLNIREVSRTVSDPEISKLIIELATPAQRYGLMRSCQEMSSAVVVNSKRSEAKIDNITEFAILVESHEWNCLWNAARLPAGSRSYYTQTLATARNLYKHNHIDSANLCLMVALRLYQSGDPWPAEANKLDFEAIETPMHMSLATRTHVVLNEIDESFRDHRNPVDNVRRTHWIWQWRCKQVQARIIEIYGFQILIANNKVWQSDIRNPHLTSELMLIPEIYSVISQHKRFLRVMAERDWHLVFDHYLGLRGMRPEAIRAAFKYRARKCISLLVKDQATTFSLLGMIIRNQDVCGAAAVSYLQTSLGEIPKS